MMDLGLFWLFYTIDIIGIVIIVAIHFKKIPKTRNYIILGISLVGIGLGGKIFLAASEVFSSI